MEKRIPARLKRNHERQRGLFETRLLQQGVDVQMMRRQNLSQPRHDSRLIAHEKPQVPRRLEVTAALGRRVVALYVSLARAGQVLPNEHQIGNDSHSRWISASARAEKCHVAA